MTIYDRRMMFVFAVAVLIGVVESRAVNISNTWMLPEEGFPVFYRYFRDRISWYEADAVCQFHHANLVTADSSSQYDAIRAYLKELDITEKVWIGLSKTSEKPNFVWTDFHTLSGEGHWQEALPVGESQSLCAVMDPAADFLWRPLPCGGPEVAAFICELPIPSWALGPKGCLLTELPSLTVLYIPEQSALELTSDCGLDGTKRIACKGNADREEILKQLTCAISNEDIDEDKSTKTSTSDYYETSTSDENSAISKTAKTWTSNTISVDYGMPTRHRRETEDTLSPVSTKSSFKEIPTKDLTWPDTHRSKTVLTTQHNMPALDDFVTPTPATSFEIAKTKSTATENAPLLESKVSDKISELSTENKKETQHLKIQDTTEMTGSTEPQIKLTSITSKVTEETTTNSKYDTNITAKQVTETVASSTATQEDNAGEYPSSINQGQLFSIIANGTMFDIIELNETEQETQINKIQNTSTVAPSTYASITEKSTETTYTPTVGSSTENNIPTKKYTSKKPILPTKKYTKEFSDKKIAQISKISSSSADRNKENLTKEFEIMPDIKYTSIKLNRTFRKEVPHIVDENAGLESGSQFGVPRILNFTISNTLDLDGEGYQQDQPHDNTTVTENTVVSELVGTETEKVNRIESVVDSVSALNEKIDPITMVTPVESKHVESFATEISKAETDKKIDILKAKTQEASTVPVHNPIDPRIYMLNHNPGIPKNNQSESVTTVKSQSSTEEPKLAKEEFLPKSLLGENIAPLKSTTQTNIDQGISEAYTEHPFPSDEPKKINRHRSLHTSKQRKFYPYFFSRMLG